MKHYQKNLKAMKNTSKQELSLRAKIIRLLMNSKTAYCDPSRLNIRCQDCVTMYKQRRLAGVSVLMLSRVVMSFSNGYIISLLHPFPSLLDLKTAQKMVLQRLGGGRALVSWRQREVEVIH